ncbi:hypothetical protein [Priestia aryabhattai]|uniref:hypothetical protein n=1 Tax=Priestia aryabhattai TaxID=412384 RepID=UPI0030C998A7
MKYSYEEYLKSKEKKSNISKAIRLGIDGIADIPFVGNTIKAGAEFLNESLENKNELSRSIDAKKQVRYFMLESDDYYDDMANKIFTILGLEKVQKKFGYNIRDIEFEIDEHLDDDWNLLENVLRLTFLDNPYYNSKAEENEYGGITISFKEEFKQINFEESKVYSAFEIISVGFGHEDNDSERNYIEFANLICYLLSNSKLIK